VHFLIYLPLAAPLLAAAAARPIAGRLPPQAATWLLTAAAVALAGLSTAVLGLLALTAILRIPMVADLGDLSEEVIRNHDPASLTAAVAACALLAAATMAAGRAGWRRARALVAAAHEARCLPGSSQVVIVPDGSADAYAMPGWPGRIVVTAGMLDALDPAERRVLLEHERAHAAGHHYLFTALTYFAAAANPLLRPVAAAVTYTVERWADERAACACGDRRLAARAVGKAALASAEGGTAGARNRRPAGAAAVGIAGAAALRSASRRRSADRVPRADRVGWADRLRGAGPVPRRVAALLAPPLRIRPLLVVAFAAIVLVSGVSALEAARDLHAIVELAQGTGIS
jgi:hypothetical protein